ncbi:hypothetical protein GCM10010390_39560 [Streptomyces mordarskii]|uniref:Uncharacterized protein n=1 Tax=Streptomyces mordarskii TaxID=1226758 RepID=A0ABP3N286_9ACTN
MGPFMNLNDILDRAELQDEFVQRLGSVPVGGRRPRLDEQWKSVWRLFETACQFYGPSQPESLAKAVKLAHEQYMAPGSLRTAGFLRFLYCTLCPQVSNDQPIPSRMEWAARVMETIRAGIGDREFTRFAEALDDALATFANPELSPS